MQLPFFRFIITISLFFLFKITMAQTMKKDSIGQVVTLDECINYALNNQPVFKQTQIDQQIAERTIKAGLAGWAPQVRTEYNYNHYFLRQVAFIQNVIQPFGPYNNSNLLFQADQVFFNSDVLLAAKGAKYTRLQAYQNIENNKIAVISDVSKAFYDVLLTRQQLAVLNQDIVRQQKLLKDSYNQYQAGMVDKLDYRRTTISLNNVQSQKKRTEEALKYKYTYLKQLMGFPAENNLSVTYDSLAMQQESFIDTTQALNYERRIEYQLLNTQLELQTLNAKYYQWSALPSVTGFINYNFYYLSNNINDLYNGNHPNSLANIKVAMPLFQGGRRLQNLQRAKLQVQRAKLGMTWTKEQIQTQYDQALGIYKSNLNDLRVQQTNLGIAKEVYDLVKLQYDQGIRTYLDVITAESELRNSQINYLNALYNVLSSKLDTQRALGTLTNPQ